MWMDCGCGCGGCSALDDTDADANVAAIVVTAAADPVLPRGCSVVLAVRARVAIVTSAAGEMNGPQTTDSRASDAL